MRIGLYHGPLYRGEEGGYETYGPYARYVHEFARHCDEVAVFAPVATRDSDYRGCAIEAPNVRVIELPDFRTHIQATRHLATLYRTFRREVQNLDIINCRNTAPYGYLLYYLGRPHGVGFFYHFTSDPWEILRVGPRYRGLLGRLARSAYRLDFHIQKRVMRHVHSFVNGRVPCERLRAISDRVEPILSTTLTRSDFVKRTDHALHKPVRLLYVGYLKHMKGLVYLVDALKMLCDRGEDVELHLVGSGPEENTLRRRIDGHQLARRVHFHGYVSMGPLLNRHYDDADIFVFPSLSEGSPRVVLEALAHSLPVVSSDVGSVPELITNGESGIIVPSCDPGALAAGVARFIHEDALRTRCARGGYTSAERHTVDRFVGRLIEKARELRRPGGTIA